MTASSKKKNKKIKNQENSQTQNIISNKLGSLLQNPFENNQIISELANISDFATFVKQYAIIGVAIGIVIGNTTQNAVKQLVDGLLTPFISVILKVFFSQLESIGDWTFTLLDIEFRPGLVVKSILEYLLIVFIIYIIVKKILRQDKLLEKNA
ncbi:MAG: hypothetical protein KatS3mg083_331 [Candidatus Dojkabacteria bacterium]|nr:MAG: hypothetical protein KatS3mg083_331 [Candidatus Dojkabacteria bacterium]